MPSPPKRWVFTLTAERLPASSRLKPCSDRHHRPATGHCTVERPALLDAGDTGTSCSLDDFTCAPGQTIARRAVTPWLPLQLLTQRQSNMARLNLGSVAAMVLAAIVVLLLGAGSYMVSSRMNRDAETVGNSASAPNSPGGINEQPMKDRTTPRQNEPPLVETNVPPAGR